jgi:transcription antitermination factor NusB
MRRARSQAREAALKALYQADLRHDFARDDALAFLGGQGLPDDAAEFARQLVEGTLVHRLELDAEIEAVAHNWNLKRMAVVDRNVLRLGAYELMFREDLPPAVSINEAVMLAKRYSTAESGSFVNGILDQIHRRHRASDRSADERPVPSDATE